MITRLIDALKLLSEAERAPILLQARITENEFQDLETEKNDDDQFSDTVDWLGSKALSYSPDDRRQLIHDAINFHSEVLNKDFFNEVFSDCGLKLKVQNIKPKKGL